MKIVQFKIDSWEFDIVIHELDSCQKLWEFASEIGRNIYTDHCRLQQKWRSIPNGLPRIGWTTHDMDYEANYASIHCMINHISYTVYD